jgi:hypothetical protein
VSAAIIQFIPRPRRRGGPNDAIASFFGRTISPWIMPIRRLANMLALASNDGRERGGLTGRSCANCRRRRGAREIGRRSRRARRR